jgi:raffinose/stachyose/melibiose transport system permease protein
VKRPPALAFLAAFLFLAAAVYLYPLFLVVINSLKTFREIMANVVALPAAPTLDNFVNAFARMEYPRLFLNTLIATVCGTTGVVLISSVAGHKLSRTKTRLSWLVFVFCVAPMMIPFHSYMIGLVKVARTLRLTSSVWGLGVLYWGLGAPLATFMYHGFAKTIPVELDESAIIDGCGPLRKFFLVVFPLLKPVTVSVVVLNAMWMWNDFLLPLLVLSGERKAMTLQLAAYNFFGQYKVEWHYAMAGVLLTILPAIAFYLALQKQIMEGMVAGAVKA